MSARKDPAVTLNQCYRLFNLSNTATLSQVKKAYRKKAMQWHPDRNAAPEAERMFDKYTKAYDYILSGGVVPNEPSDHQNHRDPAYRPKRARRKTGAKKRHSQRAWNKLWKQKAMRSSAVFLLQILPMVVIVLLLLQPGEILRPTLFGAVTTFIPLFVLISQFPTIVNIQIVALLDKNGLFKKPFVHLLILLNFGAFIYGTSGEYIEGRTAVYILYWVFILAGIVLYKWLKPSVQRYSVAIFPTLYSCFLLYNFYNEIIPLGKFIVK